MFFLIYCCFLIPMISVIDGGYLGLYLSGGSVLGMMLGIFCTGCLLYGVLIYLENKKDRRR